MICIDDLCPQDLIVLANTIALAFTKDKTADEINLLGNFIVGIGSLMLTFAAQQQYLSSKQEAKKSATKDTVT